MTDTRANILQWVEESPTSARYISAASKLDRLPADGLPEVRIALLRNITLESALPYLTVECFRAGLRPNIYLGTFDGVQQDAFDPQSPLFQFQPDLIVIALRLHTLAPALVSQFTQLTPPEIDELVANVIERVGALIRAIRDRSSATILVHNFELSPAPAYGLLDAQLPHGQHKTIRRLNDLLAEVVAATSGAHIVDLAHLMACVGYDNALDDRYWHIGRAPYKAVLLQRLTAEYTYFAAALKGRNRKCLVLDCDNTLWGGVIGEDGLNGIHLGPNHPGSAFVEFHAAILDLYNRGILLALNSKNNEPDAMAVLTEHPSSLLKPDHFVARRINWQDKATNLRELAAELNLGLDSFVFIDDNPVECGFVREALPEVVVVQLPPDPTRYRSILQNMRCFDTLALTEEDRRRSSLYRQEAQRAELRRESASLADYLQSLEMTLEIGQASPDANEIPRIAQLTQKTNQFNVTTRRYSEDDVRQFAGDPNCAVYWARARDRFDDNGLIAVAIVRYEKNEAYIDTFLMSCRVIGRGIEQGILAYIAGLAALRGSLHLLGEFIPTAKNSLVEDLFPKNGFSPMESEAGRWWRLSLEEQTLAAPDWFKEIVIREREQV